MLYAENWLAEIILMISSEPVKMHVGRFGMLFLAKSLQIGPVKYGLSKYWSFWGATIFCEIFNLKINILYKSFGQYIEFVLFAFICLLDNFWANLNLNFVYQWIQANSIKYH